MSDTGRKAVDGIKRGFDFLRTKTTETIELGKLSQQVGKLEARRSECYVELGQRVVVMFDMDKFEADSLKERVNEVHELTRQIEALQAQQQTLRHAHDPIPLPGTTAQEEGSAAPAPGSAAPHEP